MHKITYDKLVRDKIIEIIESDDKTCTYYIADEGEYRDRLNQKLIEEVNEYIENPCIEEIADILEVITSICRVHNIEESELMKVKRDKAFKRGGFEGKIILETVYTKD